MCELKPKPCPQRSKSGKMWPTWLRDPRLLKWSIRIGVIAYRLWRLWRSLSGDPPDG